VSIDAAFGNLNVAASIAADGEAPGHDGTIAGGGGEISLTAAGSTIIQRNAPVSAKSKISSKGGGYGGFVTVAPYLSASTLSLVDASGDSGGGEVDFCAGTDVTLGKVGTDENHGTNVDVSGRGSGGTGGPANITAGINGQGSIDIFGTVDVTGGTGADSAGGSTNINGCTITVEASGAVLAQAPGDGGENNLAAGEQIKILGRVDARSTGVGATMGTDGTNTFEGPQNDKPLIQIGTVIPAASVTMKAPCIAENVPPGCIVPCPECGDGDVDFPETCDNGTGQSCQPESPGSTANCSFFCRLETCDDGLFCTTDVCDPQLGCNNIPATTPCVEPSATPSHTPAISPPSTATVTPTPTLSPAPTDTPSPTATVTTGCTGDCDASGDVTVNELITLVNIALGTAPASACPHGIPSGVEVDITLIIKAVGYALTNCPAP
jgi:hypothetical protein